MLIDLLEMIIVGVSQCFLKFLIFQDRIVKTCQFWQKLLGLKLAFNILRKFPCLSSLYCPLSKKQAKHFITKNIPLYTS